MPYRDEIRDGANGPALRWEAQAQAQRREVERLEGVRDRAVAGESNPAAAELARAAWQAEIDRARERLEETEQKLRGAQVAE